MESLGPEVVTRVELWFGETLQVWRSAQGPTGPARAADLLWQRWWENYAPSALERLRGSAQRPLPHSQDQAGAASQRALVHELRVTLYAPHGVLAREALLAPERWFTAQDALLLTFGRHWQLFAEPAQGGLLEPVSGWLKERKTSLEHALEAPRALVRMQQVGVGRWFVALREGARNEPGQPGEITQP